MQPELPSGLSVGHYPTLSFRRQIGVPPDYEGGGEGDIVNCRGRMEKMSKDALSGQ